MAEKTKKPLKIQSKKEQLRHDRIMQAVSLAVFFCFWQVIAVLNKTTFQFINVNFFPAPSDILLSAWSMVKDGSLFTHMMSSFQRTLFGFAWSVALATVLGVLVTNFKAFDNIFTPIMTMLGPIPTFAFLPLFIVWFGIGETSKIIMIAYATFMPLFTYICDGIRSVNPVLIRSASSLGASKFQIFTKVILKSALPNAFVGMRVSLGSSFSALVVAELMGASSGLGYMISYARAWFYLDMMFVAAILIGVEYTVFMFVLKTAERLLFPWKKNGLDAAIEE